MAKLAPVEHDRTRSVIAPRGRGPACSLGNTAKSGSKAENMPVCNSAESAGIVAGLIVGAALAFCPIRERDDFVRAQNSALTSSPKTRRRAAQRKKGKR
jgi:hypothetical protein